MLFQTQLYFSLPFNSSIQILIQRSNNVNCMHMASWQRPCIWVMMLIWWWWWLIHQGLHALPFWTWLDHSHILIHFTATGEVAVVFWGITKCFILISASFYIQGWLCPQQFCIPQGSSYHSQSVKTDYSILEGPSMSVLDYSIWSISFSVMVIFLPVSYSIL
jgi:hypothetical protein